MSFKSHYRIERKLDTRRVKLVNVIVGVLATFLAVTGVAIFLISGAANEQIVDVSENKPTTGQVQSSTSNFVLFEEPEYKVWIPSDWVQQDSRKDQYYDYITYGVEGEYLTGRSLTIYRNKNRDVPAVTRIVPITTQADKIHPENVSGQCYKFTDLTKAPLDEPAPSKWGNVTFPCNPNTIQNVIGVSSEKSGFGVDLKGRHFTFIFIDHSSQPDTSIFLNVLKRFEAR